MAATENGTLQQGSFKNIQARQGSLSNRTALQQQTSVKSGWLKKQGGIIKSWHNRWFTIKGDQMYYFTGVDENKSLGSIFLPGNKVVEHPLNPVEPDRFLFEIIPGENKSRMTATHETYPLCASNDEDRKAWIRAIRKVMYSDKGGALFGQSLGETMKYENRTSSRSVPLIIEMCVEFLMDHGLQVEGIFRLPGRVSVIRKLQESFDCGERVPFTLSEVDVHSVASLLKSYLRELPEPIIPLQFYENVMKLVTRDMHGNPDAAITRLSRLLSNIPRHNYNLLKYLCHFLQEVSKHVGVNKMSEMNLATVFVNSLIRPEDEDPALLMGTANGRTQVVFLLISQWENIFKVEYTPQGGSVQVDNLLDLDFEGNVTQFKANTALEAGRENSVPVPPADLLGLDLNYAESSDALPAPLVTSPLDTPLSVEEPIYDEVPSQPRKSRSFSVDAASTRNVSPDTPSDSTGSEVSMKNNDNSAERTTPIRRAPPAPPRRSSTSSAPESADYATILPSRPAPPPPPVLNHAESNGSLDAVYSLAGEEETNEHTNASVDSLINMDVSDFTVEDLHSHIKSLCSELKAQSNSYQELKLSYANLQEKYKKQLTTMAKKIDAEKTARVNAIEKVMQLQNELQGYSLKYGLLQ